MNGSALTRFLFSVLIVGLAAWLGWRLWQDYMDAPWTRDGRVRADIVQVTADVPGRVVAVAVQDNQLVKQGALLFRIDPARYELAVQTAEAALKQADIQLALKKDQAARRAGLDPSIVAHETQQDSKLAVRAAEAQRAAAQAALALARLNLERTAVRAPVAGTVTNLLLQPGDYAAVGAPKLALVQAHSFWVYGYFEETRLQKIALGDPAEVTLLGQTQPLKGRVTGIAPAITDRDNPVGADLTASVNPVFNWVRLASRIPVRIQLDPVPANMHLAAGMTCTVVIRPADHP
ncbi:efflux RND transporter periplasmic adaptor subunit [Halothiobacillus sp. DCM-1]|uniref:efflux RND transporter periplasmic adaptor subunit n=1 Tax=Halothiobacillus sp. DCM-1 TaxID=3112558 RepID=UPI00324541DF